MHSRLTISVILLAVVIGCGIGNIGLTKDISRRYIAAAEELRTLVQAESWQRVEETAGAYHEAWRDTLNWLQMLINHADGDEVSYALESIQAGAAARDAATCLVACAQLREAAEHIYHRDAFTLANIL